MSFDYLQVDRFAKKEERRYTFRNCIRNTFLECTPEKKTFLIF